MFKYSFPPFFTPAALPEQEGNPDPNRNSACLWIYANIKFVLLVKKNPLVCVSSLHAMTFALIMINLLIVGLLIGCLIIGWLIGNAFVDTDPSETAATESPESESRRQLRSNDVSADVGVGCVKGLS